MSERFGKDGSPRVDGDPTTDTGSSLKDVGVGEIVRTEATTPQFIQKAQRTAEVFSRYIRRVAMERRSGIPTAEVYSIFKNDLLSALRTKVFNYTEVKEIMAKIGDASSLDTGEKVEIPLQTGEFARFDLVIRHDSVEHKLKFDLVPTRGNEPAERIVMDAATRLN